MPITYHNLIILDRSGSMSSIRSRAVAGVNETLGTIRAFARDNGDTVQRVTLLAFCACRMQYIFDDKPIESIDNISPSDYEPCCSTPLYDAIGTACSKLLARSVSDPDCKVSVTIITDGYENASREWTREGISRLISSLKEKGWLIAYIGADHDVEHVAMSININNYMQFDKSEDGTAEMFRREARSRSRWMKMAKNVDTACLGSQCNDKYFDED